MLQLCEGRAKIIVFPDQLVNHGLAKHENAIFVLIMLSHLLDRITRKGYIVILNSVY